MGQAGLTHIERDQTESANDRVKLGSLLAEVGREVALTDEEAENFVRLRDKTPAEPIHFEQFPSDLR